MRKIFDRWAATTPDHEKKPVTSVTPVTKPELLEKSCNPAPGAAVTGGYKGSEKNNLCNHVTEEKIWRLQELSNENNLVTNVTSVTAKNKSPEKRADREIYSLSKAQVEEALSWPISTQRLYVEVQDWLEQKKGFPFSRAGVLAYFATKDLMENYKDLDAPLNHKTIEEF